MASLDILYSVGRQAWLCSYLALKFLTKIKAFVECIAPHSNYPGAYLRLTDQSFFYSSLFTF